MRSRLTARASADIRAVLRSSGVLFGPRQVLAYASLLNRAVSLVAEDPHRPGSRSWPQFPEPVRSFHLERAAGRRGAARHELFYTVCSGEDGSEEVLILRVLHDAMDPGRRVGASLRDDFKRS